MKHYLPGRAYSLEDALGRMRTVLNQLGIELEPVRWYNPVPEVWSVHVRAQGCPILFANGKGTSRLAAEASATGEFLERLLTGYFFGDYALPCRDVGHGHLFVPDEVVRSAEQAWLGLPASLRALWSDGEALDAASALPSLSCCGEKVHCLPLEPLCCADGPVEVPWNILMNFYGSNGLSGGCTELEAQIQGLSEIFERWVRRQVIERNACLPEVPESVWSGIRSVRSAVHALRKAGVHVSIRDASLGEGYPVIAVILHEAGRAFVSFGAHPILRVAIERTLTEAFQGRALADRSAWQAPSDDLDWVCSWENQMLHFIDASGQFHWRFFSSAPDWGWQDWGLPEDSSLDAQWQSLLMLLRRLNQPLYGAVYSAGGYFASRLIAPGMSEVFPPWELTEENQNEGCVLRRHLMAFENTPRWQAALLEILDDAGWAPHQSVASLIGLAASGRSAWKSEKVADLRLRASLMLQDPELEGILEEAIHLAQGHALREGAYRYVKFSLSNEGEELFGALSALYGEDAVRWGRELVSGFVWQDLELGRRLFADPLHQAMLKLHPGLRRRT